MRRALRHMKRWAAPFVSCAFLCVPALQARDLTLIVQRAGDSTELYISAPAPVLFEVFGADEAIVPSQSGYVDFAAFYEGTWPIGDALIERTGFAANGTDLGFEGMSFMLHPNTDALPFDTPLDGMIAISVCNVIPGTDRYQMQDLLGYVGYFSEVNTTNKAIDVTLSAPLKRALEVKVIDVTGRHSETTRFEFKAGETVALSVAPAQAQVGLNWGALLLSVLIAGASLFVGLRIPGLLLGRRRPIANPGH